MKNYYVMSFMLLLSNNLYGMHAAAFLPAQLSMTEAMKRDEEERRKRDQEIAIAINGDFEIKYDLETMDQVRDLLREIEPANYVKELEKHAVDPVVPVQFINHLIKNGPQGIEEVALCRNTNMFIHNRKKYNKLLAEMVIYVNNEQQLQGIQEEPFGAINDAMIESSIILATTLNDTHVALCASNDSYDKSKSCMSSYAVIGSISAAIVIVFSIYINAQC